jgi:hypothetical protein
MRKERQKVAAALINKILEGSQNKALVDKILGQGAFDRLATEIYGHLCGELVKNSNGNQPSKEQ